MQVKFSMQYAGYCRAEQNGDIYQKDTEIGTAFTTNVLAAEGAFEKILQANSFACIAEKTNAILKHNFDKEVYKSRNKIERFFQRIRKFNTIATHYDKLSVCFLNFVILLAIMIQI